MILLKKIIYYSLLPFWLLGWGCSVVGEYIEFLQWTFVRSLDSAETVAFVKQIRDEQKAKETSI